MKFPKPRTRGDYCRAALLALVLATVTATAGAADNPFIAGMRAMLNSMGFEENTTPFGDDDPFTNMGDASPFDMGSWSGMGSMPGMGFSPW